MGCGKYIITKLGCVILIDEQIAHHSACSVDNAASGGRFELSITDGKPRVRVFGKSLTLGVRVRADDAGKIEAFLKRAMSESGG